MLQDIERLQLAALGVSTTSENFGSGRLRHVPSALTKDTVGNL